MKKDKTYDIFISYRRLDERGNISGRDQARLIAKQLELEGYHPFFDYSEIKDNEFDKIIIPAVEKCKIFIIVLTKDSLNRCKNDDDWVRREIETAIKTGCKIINLSPDNTFDGWPKTLPQSLGKIKNIQISDIHFGSLFELSIKKLIDDRIKPGLLSSKHCDTEEHLQCIEDDNEFVDSFEEIYGTLSAEDLYQKGLAFFHGRGIEKDKYTAISYYKKAAILEHPKAQRLLYACYLSGIGCKKDEESALYWLEKAANNHELFCIHTLAKYFTDNSIHEKAYTYYKIIVDKYENNNNKLSGNEDSKLQEYYIESIINIGKLWETGQFFKKDYEQAKHWYRKAIALGEKRPMAELLDKIKAEANEGLIDDLPEMMSYDDKYELAKRYLFGIGLDKSFNKALPLLLDCASNGNYMAYKHLGMCYIYGYTLKEESWSYELVDVDCERNYSLGYQYLTNCANHISDSRVYYELGLLHELGLGTQLDMSIALIWYKKAIAIHSVEAVRHIGALYRYGKIYNEPNIDNFIICESYSKIIYMRLSKTRYSEFSKENISFDINLFSPNINLPHYSTEHYQNFIKYYEEILQKIGLVFNENIGEYPLYETIEYPKELLKDLWLEDKIKKNWSHFENTIIRDFNHIINNLKSVHFNMSFDLDSKHIGIDAIDLGLSSGTLWCSKNIFEGETDDIERLYSWGEDTSKNSFTWTNYFDSYNDLTGKFKYINHNSAIFYDEENADLSSIICVDVAKKHFGEMWTIPTRNNIAELINECSWNWVQNNECCGYNVVGRNGNNIFLPVIDNIKRIGSYWSFSLNKKDARYADFLYFDERTIKIRAAQRYMGLMVRPIAIINNKGEIIESGLQF